ncbi:MAG: phosphotransferase, partial [Polaromonas sp.]|nr:phosphotransferase [Polaromonas sp.]
MTESPIVWPDATRAGAFSAWLQAHAPTHGLLPETVQPASADASFRRYFRVRTADGGSCIIMDAPPAQEDCAPFVKVAGLMAGAGLNAPRVLAWDQAQGFMLLSDLGARTMLEVIEQQPEAGKAQRAYDLYREAVDALVRWQLASQPDVLPPYDDALLARELALFPDWYVEKHRGITVDSTLRGKLDGLFAQIKDSNLNSLGGARVFVHRDFMPRNLIAPTLFTSCASGVALPLTSGTGANFSRGGPSDNFTTATGNSGLGILDFQDAVYGPITYDIA